MHHLATNESGEKMFRRCSLSILVLIPMAASCQVEEPTTATSTTRHVFSNENAPQSILFARFVNALYLDSIETDGSRDQYLEPGVTEKSNVDELFHYFIVLKSEIDEEVQSTTFRMMCSGDATDASTLYLVFDALDDARDAIYKKYVHIAKGELGRRFDLDKALANLPEQFTVIWQNHAYAYEESGADAMEVAKTICARLTSQWFATKPVHQFILMTYRTRLSNV